MVAVQFRLNEAGERVPLTSAQMQQLAAAQVPMPEVAPILFTYKVDLFRRATEEECETIEGLLAGLSSKMRRLFEGATRLEHNADEFAMLYQAAVSQFGPDRAAELLAPSVG